MELSQPMQAIIFIRASLDATPASDTFQEGRGVTAKQGVKIKVLIGSLKTIKLTQVNHFMVYHTYHSGEIV